MTVDPTSSNPLPGRDELRRPVRLLDLMALVAAVALTMVSPAIIKAMIPAASHFNWDRRQVVIDLISLVLFWWTAILVLLALQGSRSNFASTSRQPGSAALFSVAAAFVFLGVQQIVTILVIVGGKGWPPTMLKLFWLFSILENAAEVSGASVVVAWLILGSTRTWRRPSNWFERLGCLVGVIWIVWGLAGRSLWHLPIRWLNTSGIPW